MPDAAQPAHPFRVILHLDMDAFFASVEQRDNPELQGRPVIVGGVPSQRGVVCAASYEARRYGVKSAMPSSTAGKLCPEGCFVRPRMEAYRNESRAVMAIVQRSGAVVEQMSIDEAYLELTSVVVGEDADAALLAALPLARSIKQAIRSERDLTASIGIASNKLLAKLGSDFNKPDGLTLIPERDKVAFLRPLPVRAIHGVGKVTEQELLRVGLRTVGDLQDYQGDLQGVVGSFGARLKAYAFGEDDRQLDLDDTIKSVSAEETFSSDTDDRVVLRRFLREASREIAGKLERRRLVAKTVQVKVRYGDFSTLTRQLTLQDPVTDSRDIYRLGCFILARHRLVSRPLRLLGLGVNVLDEQGGHQLLLL
jgi:DNA polymerase-4